MEVFKEPAVFLGVLCIPFIVIAIARNWAKIKEKKAAAASGANKTDTTQS